MWSDDGSPTTKSRLLLRHSQSFGSSNGRKRSPLSGMTSSLYALDPTTNTLFAQYCKIRRRTALFWSMGIVSCIALITCIVALTTLTLHTASTILRQFDGVVPSLSRSHRRRIQEVSDTATDTKNLPHSPPNTNHKQAISKEQLTLRLDNPVWWLEDTNDDYYNRTYINEYKPDLHPRDLYALRTNISISHFFHGACGRYRFNTEAMPDISVIVTTQNEFDQMLSMTVHSILARTPSNILKEIIIVDDNGLIPEEQQQQEQQSTHGSTRNINETELLHIQKLPKVRIIHNVEREGCARSRMIGAKVATGQVLMFVDSHIEMTSSTWAQHLILPIIENPHTMSLQTLDVISDLTRNYFDAPGPNLFGSVSDDFLFTYESRRFDMKRYSENPARRLPYETPFGPGSLFAIRRDEFWRLGGYDKGLYVWGGENTELALKMWMCGGRIVMVPCSRTGHMYRSHIKQTGRWPPDVPQSLADRLGIGVPGEYIVRNGKADNFTKVVSRNNIRVASIWLGDHPAKKAYYKIHFGSENLPPEWKQFEDDLMTDQAAQEQIRIKEENKCKDFEWFDRHVFFKLLGKHHPWHPSHPKMVVCGAHKTLSCAACPQGHGQSWCNGECTWCVINGVKGKCLHSTDIQGCEMAKRSAAMKAAAIEEKKQTAAKKAVKEMPVNDVTVFKDGKSVRLVDELHSTLISVVLPCGFEHEYFERTALSVFNATPPDLLKEIIIVDDASDPPLEPLFAAGDASKYKVRFVRLDLPHGLIGAKHAGAMAATGDIIVFFDCHVKPDNNYWRAFVDIIKPNYRRVVVPTITNLNADTWEEEPGGRNGGGMSKCYLTFDGEFKWTQDSTPYVPIMSGGLLAMSRRWYVEVAGYDDTMRGWGGENLDQSLRIWRCGGEIVSSNSSFVAHMWRDVKHKAKYKVAPGDSALNRARAMKAHTESWFAKTVSFPAFKKWKSDGGIGLDVSSITNALYGVHCKSFEWYLWRFRYVYRDAGVLPREVFQIASYPTVKRNNVLCLQLQAHQSWNNAGAANDDVELAPCVDEHSVSSATSGTQWWHLSNRSPDNSCCSGLRVWNSDQCLDGTSTSVCLLEKTVGAKLGEDGLLRVNGQGCLSVTFEEKVELSDCSVATKWERRGVAAPIEFELLSKFMKDNW